MSRLALACFIIAAEILLVQTMADRSQTSQPFSTKLLIRSGILVQSQSIVIKAADPPLSSGGTESSSPENDEKESSVAEAPEIRKMGKHNSTDKSVAGGGVIIGGLVTAIFAAVYCYIRVTRRRDSGEHSGGGDAI